MKFPIILNESNNLYFYKSIEDAELDLEVEDVKNNEYSAYDANGVLLQLGTISESISSSFFGMNTVEKVKIDELDMGVDESDKLKKVLIENFKDKDIYNLEDESMEFGDIVSKAIKLYGYAF